MKYYLLNLFLKCGPFTNVRQPLVVAGCVSNTVVLFSSLNESVRLRGLVYNVILYVLKVKNKAKG